MPNRNRGPWLALPAAMLMLSLAAAPAPSPLAAAAEEQDKQSQASIDVNKATVDELATVTGIGRVLAERIVEFRETNGPYGSVDDLLKVKGIGEKLLGKIRGQLVAGRAKR